MYTQGAKRHVHVPGCTHRALSALFVYTALLKAPVLRYTPAKRISLSALFSRAPPPLEATCTVPNPEAERWVVLLPLPHRHLHLGPLLHRGLLHVPYHYHHLVELTVEIYLPRFRTAEVHLPMVRTGFL